MKTRTPNVLWLGTVLLTALCGCSSAGPGGSTLTYWNSLIESSGLKSGTGDDQHTQAIADLRLRADAIERLPTSGVDVEASRIGLTGARLLREHALLIEQGGMLPALAFKDGFVWGLTGEGSPFSSTLQYDGSVASWGSRYQTWCNETQAARVQLTNRYGVEFPNLIRGTPAKAVDAPTRIAAEPGWWSRQSWRWKLLVIGVAVYLLVQFLSKNSKRVTNVK